jgi:membrane protein required for colicin V production
MHNPPVLVRFAYMVIDILLLLLAAAGFWLGYTKGIVATLFSVITYVLAMIAAFAFAPWLTTFLIRSMNMDHIFALAIGTLVFFFAALLLIRWLGKRLETYLKKRRSDRLTKILGGIVMMLVAIFFYTLILWWVNTFGLIGEKMKLASLTYETLETIPSKASVVVGEFKTIFKRYWELINELLKEQPSPSSG